MRHYPRVKRIEVPACQREDDHRDHRNEDEDLEGGGDLADGLNAADIDPCQQSDETDRNQIMLPPGHPWKGILQIIGEEHSVNTAKTERRSPIPPSGEESPEIAEGGARP